MAAKKLVAVDFEVFGKVQGVFFRKHTQKQAKKLDIRGWCKNTDQGTVEGQLEGVEQQIGFMKDWLEKTGSPSSRIERAEFKNEKAIEDYTFSGFNIRH
ncbi:acylphosphatase-2-like isoform X1 [Macrobrachium nipponense]|uniref:acylphosphatase-2-like isoform X1 n=1 Tax=Macrobrachium nipponense TaxID=159736 RepID=UPI0030C89528